MARILSVSYEHALLVTRHQILAKQSEHAVTSVRDLPEALEACRSDEQFDVLVIGHSIPHAEKETLIHAFRDKRPKAAVVALKRHGEDILQDADLSIEPNPQELLKTLANLVD